MAENEGTENKLDHDSESELELEDPLDSLDELELNLPVAPAPPAAAAAAPPEFFLEPPSPSAPAPAPPPPPCGPRFCPASDRFFRGFFRSDEATKCSKARKVEGLSVSKSISISSGLESRKAGSRC